MSETITDVASRQGVAGADQTIQNKIQAEAREWDKFKLRRVTFTRLGEIQSGMLQDVAELESRKNSQEARLSKLRATRDSYNSWVGLEGSWLQLRDSQAMRLSRLASDLAARIQVTESELSEYRLILNVLAELVRDADAATS